VIDSDQKLKEAMGIREAKITIKLVDPCVGHGNVAKAAHKLVKILDDHGYVVGNGYLLTSKHVLTVSEIYPGPEERKGRKDILYYDSGKRRYVKNEMVAEGFIAIDDLKLVIFELKETCVNYKTIAFKDNLEFKETDILQIYGCTRNAPEITADKLRPIHEFSDTFFYYEKQEAENKTKTGGLIFKGE
jgi:hypothetical protein